MFNQDRMQKRSRFSDDNPSFPNFNPNRPIPQSLGQSKLWDASDFERPNTSYAPPKPPYGSSIVEYENSNSSFRHSNPSFGESSSRFEDSNQFGSLNPSFGDSNSSFSSSQFNARFGNLNQPERSLFDNANKLFENSTKFLGTSFNNQPSFQQPKQNFPRLSRPSQNVQNLPYYQAKSQMNESEFQRARFLAFGNNEMASRMPTNEPPQGMMRRNEKFKKNPLGSNKGGDGGLSKYVNPNQGKPANRNQAGPNKNQPPNRNQQAQWRFNQASCQKPLFNKTPPSSFIRSHQDNRSNAKNITQKPPVIAPKLDIAFDDIFTLQSTTESGLKTYTCRLCKVSSLPELNLETHREGKRHKHQVQLLEDSLTGRTKEERQSQFKSLLPSKFYEHSSEFNKIISEINKPLVGLTYCIEILDSNLREPSYSCVLCDKRCDPRTMINHFLSQTHRTNYIDKHFNTLNKFLVTVPRFSVDMDYRQAVLIKVCSEIENRFGRGQAFIYEGSEFSNVKEVLSAEVQKRNHFSEEDVENSEKVLVANIDFENLESVSVIPEPLKKKRKAETSDRVGNFKGRVGKLVEELNKKLTQHKKDPGSHPLYNREWQEFWNRKCEEHGDTIKESDVLTEWYDFFTRRIQELHNEELESNIEQIQNELELTKEDIRDVDFKKYNTDVKKARFDVAGPSKINNQPNVFSDRKGRYNNEWSNEDSHPVRQIQKEILSPEQEKIMEKFKTTFKDANPLVQTAFEPQVTLIATLRILSTLEAELGLLAPKILDLLSKALSGERENPNSSEELLFNGENFNLIEMSKEKLLGLQAANLIPMHKLQAVQKSLYDVTKLLDQQENLEKIKKSLAEMGKTEASPAEMKMLMEMFAKKKAQEDEEKQTLNRERNRKKQQRQRANRMQNF